MLTQKHQSVDHEEKTTCRRLRIMYHENSDAISIEHLDVDGKVLSKCCLSIDDAWDYARTIYDVIDEALDVT